jgi:Ca-activated chloride channel family protein
MVNEIRLSQEAAVRFLETIPRARDLMTIFFDQDIRISRYDSEHQQGLFSRILETRGSGYTALYDAIAVYLSRVQNASGRRVVVLFTDGDDTTSSLSLAETIELVRSSAVTIYSIAFTGSHAAGSSQGLSARAFLHHVADLTGGDVFTPVSSKDLEGIYDKILAELGAQYVLGYVSDNTHRDGKFRKLKVEVRPKGMKVRYRGGYYAPKDG